MTQGTHSGRGGLAIAGVLLAVAAIAGAQGWLTLTGQLDGLARRGQSDLAVAADRLVGQLQRVRELSVLMADHPDLTALFAGGSRAPAEAVLRRTADLTGALDILVVDATGRVLARAGAGPQQLDPAGAPYLARALRDGALGSFHAVEAEGGALRRVFTFSAPVFAPGGPPRGAVVVRADVDKIEAEWRGDAQVVFFTDSLGVVFASNRSELLFLAEYGAPDVARQGPDAAYDAGIVTGLIVPRRWTVAGHQLWRLHAGRFLPGQAIQISRPLPVIEMTGTALVDAGPAFRLAAAQGLAIAALLLVLGAGYLALAERRRDLARRLAEEARTNLLLETRVSERTAALSTANAALRREVAERLAAEAALRTAQASLVQAAKLSALGQMSAGISHELNQPLMAISTFAGNAQAFLDRGRTAQARENLARIGELARQMGRIIRNLRAFARQEPESEPLRPVDLAAVVGAVLELSESRLRRAGVAVDWTPPPVPVRALGGEVRLQQVVMNLIANALDATEGQAAPRLALALEPGDPVRLTLRDSGPGLAEPDRIFDPFYTTKEVGQAEGMGLGLSISYAIVRSFGGRLAGRTLPEGGAEFTLELRAAAAEAA